MKMKKITMSIVLFAVMLLACLAFSSCSRDGKGEVTTLYVYNWGEYISDGSGESLDVNSEFEKYCYENGLGNVEVNYSTFSSNEDMYAKISSGAASYDVIIPSDYMIQRMVGEGLLQKLDLNLIPNYENISPAFRGENVYYEDDDPTTVYSVPYFYGMVGVIYNTSIVPENEEQLGSWGLMWDTDYRGDILQFNNSRDAFGTAQYYLQCADVNHPTDEEWMAALNKLKEQKDIVQGYVMDEIFNKMEGDSAAVAAYYAGDFLTMYEENDKLAFYYPKEGTNSYIDAMCVPKNAKNAELAMHYINFMCETEIAVANAEYTYYASPLTTVVNDAGYRATMEEVHADAMNILYDSADSVPTQPYLNLSPEDLTRLNGLWEELKVESSIGVGIYVLCALILAAIVVIVVYQIIKKRRMARLYD